MRAVPITIIAMTAGLSSASAQQPGDRYTLERTTDGYVRLDRRSGEMSLCKERDGRLLCRLASDERDARQDDVERLSRRLDDVERRMDDLARPAPTESLPSEEEFEKGLTLMETFMRRFLGIVKDLEAENSPPQKT